jgi:cytochrome bd-type quinol oxidase subunit 2
MDVVVLTTIWVELMSDPRLFKFRQKVASRDHKTLAAVALFLGGFCSRALLGTIGAAGTLGIGVGVRILVAFSWIFAPSKPSTH